MTTNKKLPFSDRLLNDIANTYGTPVFVYDEDGIRKSARAVNKAFAWSPNYVNYFAVKATPTPAILRVVYNEGMGFDCSSRPELSMVDQERLGGHGIFYTSNNTPDSDYQQADRLRAVINVDKYPYVSQVIKALGGKPPASMAIRYNPGHLKSGNDIIGDPLASKFGDTAEHVIKAVQAMKKAGVNRIGLHAMVASNEKNPEYFGDTARLLRLMAEQLKDKCGVAVKFINVGGGLGVSYHPGEEPVDITAVGEAVQSELGELGIPVFTEHGRYVTGPNGYLLTRVTQGIVKSYSRLLQIDTSVNNMARLATVKAAYHHINVLGREGDATIPMHIVGAMCANTDIMFKDRELPATIQPGDLLVIHDAGAHSRANSHNYNFRLRAGEVLVRPNGSHSLIRRHETEEDLFSTTKGL